MLLTECSALSLHSEVIIFCHLIVEQWIYKFSADRLWTRNPSFWNSATQWNSNVDRKITISMLFVSMLVFLFALQAKEKGDKCSQCCVQHMLTTRAQSRSISTERHANWKVQPATSLQMQDHILVFLAMKEPESVEQVLLHVALQSPRQFQTTVLLLKWGRVCIIKQMQDWKRPIHVECHQLKHPANAKREQSYFTKQVCTRSVTDVLQQ